MNSSILVSHRYNIGCILKASKSAAYMPALPKRLLPSIRRQLAAICLCIGFIACNGAGGGDDSPTDDWLTQDHLTDEWLIPAVITVPFGTSSDEQILTPLYKIPLDPMGVFGATDGLTFSNDGKILAGSDNLANAYLFTTEQAKYTGIMLDHTVLPIIGEHQSDGEINAMDFSPDDTMLLTGTNDVGAKVWDAASGELIVHLHDGTNTDGGAFSPNGQWLATASDGNINVYDVAADFALVISIPSSTDEVNSVDWSSDSKYLVAAGDDGYTEGLTAVQLYQTSDWSLVRDYPYPYEGSVKSVRFSPDDQLIAIGAEGPAGPPNTNPGVAQIFDVETGALLAELAHEGNLLALAKDDPDTYVRLEAVAWSRDGNYLFTSGLIDGVMRIWRRADWSLIGWAQAQEKNRAIETLDVSADNLVAIGGDEGMIYVYQFNPPPLFPPLQQDADGIVAIEVENHDTNVSQGGFSWLPRTATEVSNGTYMQAIPTGPHQVDQINQSYQTYNPPVDSPKLDYRVNFTKTGTYYVWIRARQGFSEGNSVHVGLNGQEIDTSDRIEIDDESNWEWTSDTKDDTRATFEVPSTGPHTVNLWMREVGVEMDKIVLTTDPAYDPNLVNSGLGPDESPRPMASMAAKTGFTP